MTAQQMTKFDGYSYARKPFATIDNAFARDKDGKIYFVTTRSGQEKAMFPVFESGLVCINRIPSPSATARFDLIKPEMLGIGGILWATTDGSPAILADGEMSSSRPN